jgi:hypothetical protein
LLADNALGSLQEFLPKTQMGNNKNTNHMHLFLVSFASGGWLSVISYLLLPRSGQVDPIRT